MTKISILKYSTILYCMYLKRTMELVWKSREYKVNAKENYPRWTSIWTGKSGEPAEQHRRILQKGNSDKRKMNKIWNSKSWMMIWHMPSAARHGAKVKIDWLSVMYAAWNTISSVQMSDIEHCNTGLSS